MADTKMRYCRLCNGPCEGRSICLQTPDRFKPTTDIMIKNALEKRGAFRSRAFRGCVELHQPSISSDLPDPEFSVIDRDDGSCEVIVRLTSISFIPEYINPKSPERMELEKAARNEIIRSFDLRRDRVRDGDIEVEIMNGSLVIVLRIGIYILGAIMYSRLRGPDIRRVGLDETQLAIVGVAAGAGVGLVAVCLAIGIVLFGTAFHR